MAHLPITTTSDDSVKLATLLLAMHLYVPLSDSVDIGIIKVRTEYGMPLYVKPYGTR